MKPVRALLGILFATAAITQAMPFSNRVTLPDGRKIFVSGFNLAWINFGNDVGDVALNEQAFRSAMKAVSDSGGNTMRIWLSTNGSHDPKFGSNGLVSGLGSKTIANVQKMLDIAKEYKILVLPVLLTHNFMQSGQGNDLTRNRTLLTTDAGIQAYVDNAVVPLVKAIGKNPNLLAWEICNECEGMVSGIGWTSEKVSQGDIQKITNRMAGAIRRSVPGVLVSTGTVAAAYLGWYKDNALKTAGGDADGSLDFYMIHYYGWNGTSNSPFTKAASTWGVDKPLVVGEFASSSWNQSTASSSRMQDAQEIGTSLETLLSGGYAGGLFWQYQQDGGDPWMKGFATAGTVLAKFGRAHKSDVQPEVSGVLPGPKGSPYLLSRTTKGFSLELATPLESPVSLRWVDGGGRTRQRVSMPIGSRVARFDIEGSPVGWLMLEEGRSTTTIRAINQL